MVNTFLPEPSYRLSLTYLDNLRLRKQRVEVKQILRAIRGETTGWVNHPAAKMWKEYPGSLCEYGILSCQVWRSRWRAVCEKCNKSIFGMKYATRNDSPPLAAAVTCPHCGHSAQPVQDYYKDSLLLYFEELALEYGKQTNATPWWVGIKEFHRSHQSNLIRKDPALYGPIWPGVPIDLPYFWPV